MNKDYKQKAEVMCFWLVSYRNHVANRIKFAANKQLTQLMNCFESWKEFTYQAAVFRQKLHKFLNKKTLFTLKDTFDAMRENAE
jgi:hypothetical protein